MTETRLQFLRDIFPTWEQSTNLIDVIVWPSVVLIMAIMLRRPIRTLLLLVESVSYKGVRVNFRKQLEQAMKEAKESGLDLPEEVSAETEIYRLIEVSPASAIHASWKELEVAARKKIEILAPDEREYLNHLQRPVDYLEYTGALIPSTIRIVDELQSLRNQVSHTSRIRITRDDAVNYNSLSKAILNQIEAITELPSIKLRVLTSIVAELNHLIDSGKYNQITIEEAHDAIEQKRIIPFLTQRTKDDSDFSLYGVDGPYANFVEKYHEKMYQIHNAYAGNERRKWGVENLGLCLLLAWTNEIIQQGAGWHPDEQ